eukprot:gene9203-10177_t
MPNITYQVSIIIPVHNAESWLDEALDSILKQSWRKSLEVSIFNDACTDSSLEIIHRWGHVFDAENIGFVLGHNTTGSPKGVGFAKNSAIKQSHGKYICFCDADDVMMPNRIECQLNAAVNKPSNTIVGCLFNRIPDDSTPRYTEWHNSLTEKQLYSQIYTSFGPTLIQPTWFCSREIFNTVGYFDEVKKGHPEDLVFFYKHLENNGKLCRVDEILLSYRYHKSAASFSVHEDTIWQVRMAMLEERVLPHWQRFTIWNAGKQGRRFYRSLSKQSRDKVLALCDVDEKKINKGKYRCELLKVENIVPVIPVVHFSNAIPPFVICVKINLTMGEFEKNLASLNLAEGQDYVLFS